MGDRRIANHANFHVKFTWKDDARYSFIDLTIFKLPLALVSGKGR